MLINSIKLKNYRQFKDVEIQFVESSVVPKPNNGLNELDFTSTSYNPKRQNIIYIQAENSVGKTNLESAFLWGLYGTVDDRGNLLNQEVEEQLKVVGRENIAFDKKLTREVVDTHIERIVVNGQGSFTVVYR